MLNKSLVSSGFKVFVDSLENVFALKGERPSDVFITHIDQRSWVVEHKDKDGFLQLKSIPQGSEPVSGWALDENKNKYYVYLCKESKTFYAEPLTDDGGKVGDFLVPDSGFQSSERKILAGALSDRAGVSILLEAAEELSKSAKSVALIFYVGRHLGFMGLTSSLRSVDFERIFVIEAFENNTSFDEGGVLLPVRTQRSIPPSNTSGVVTQIANKEGVGVQKVIIAEQQSAADILARSGVESLVLGIPLRYYGSSVECLKTADYDALLKLVRRLEE